MFREQGGSQKQDGEGRWSVKDLLSHLYLVAISCFKSYGPVPFLSPLEPLLRFDDIHQSGMRVLSRIQPCVTPWTAARQAPLSMGFSRQEYWSGLPRPPPGDLPDPGIEPCLPHLLHWQAGSLPLAPPGNPSVWHFILKLGVSFAHRICKLLGNTDKLMGLPAHRPAFSLLLVVTSTL